MVAIKRFQTKGTGSAGSQCTSSRRRSLSLDKVTKVYVTCSLQSALFLFSAGSKFYNPRIEAFLRGYMQPNRIDPYCRKSYSDEDASLFELYRQYAEAVTDCRDIERRGEELKKFMEGKEVRLFTAPISELTLEEMIEAMGTMAEMSVKLVNRIADKSVEPSSAAESCSSNDVESMECSSSCPSVGSESTDMDVNSEVDGSN